MTCALESRLIDKLSISRFRSIGWSGEGCYVKSTDAYQTECTCNHLTHFAVLLDTLSGTETGDISEVSVTNTPATPLCTIVFAVIFKQIPITSIFLFLR